MLVAAGTFYLAPELAGNLWSVTFKIIPLTIFSTIAASLCGYVYANEK